MQKTEKDAFKHSNRGVRKGGFGLKQTAIMMDASKDDAEMLKVCGYYQSLDAIIASTCKLV